MEALAVAAGESVDVILRDGGTLRLRPPTTADSEALLDFYRALSSQSLHRRFHGFPDLRPQLVESLLEPDWEERGALLGALADDTASGSSRSPTTCACATPQWPSPPSRSRTRTGPRDRHASARAARARAQPRSGSSGSSPRCCPRTGRCWASSRRAGFELTRELAGGEVEVEFPIASTERYERSVDERDHEAVVASLRPFFDPNRCRDRSVVEARLDRRRAVPQHARGRVHRSRLSRQPRRAPVAGVRGLPLDRGDPRAGRPGRHRAAGCSTCSTRPRTRTAQGVAALVVISAGFAEIGSEGVERQEQLLALVRSHGARLIGPNCLGIAVAGPSLNATFAARSAPRATSASRRRAARSGLRSSKRPMRAGSASRRSSRSATRPTSRRTICSSGGRTTRRRRSCCSTSSRSGIRAASAVLLAGSPEESRYSRSRADVARLVSAPRVRTPRRLRGRKPPSTRSSTRRGSFARAHSRS